MSFGYASLREMNIDFTLHEATSLLAGAGWDCSDRDIHPSEHVGCTTHWHKGERDSRAPATFLLRNGQARRWVCRYCMFTLAHATSTGDDALFSQMMDKALRTRELPDGRVKEAAA